MLASCPWFCYNGVMDRMEVYQDDVPCVLHKTHTPVTVINEMHHPFPQEWQKAIWGEVKDDTVVSLCATGHNNVHAAIRHYEKYKKYPEWCVGSTRELAERAVNLRAIATT